MAYFYLAVAIGFEFFGTILIKMADGFKNLLPGFGGLIVYALCFYFFSKSLQGINLSIAYAIWCALGIVLATVSSVLIFKESLTPVVVIGIGLIFIGVVILTLFAPSAH